MSTEAKFSFTTKIGGDRGDLFTVRGDTADEFIENLNAAINQNAVEAADTLRAIATAMSGLPVKEVHDVPAPAPRDFEGDIPKWEPPKGGGNPDNPLGYKCAHGDRTYKEGTGRNGKWQAYFCGADRSTPKSEQCDPLWYDRKTGKFQ